MGCISVVDAAGFEPAASSLRTKHSAKLSYAPGSTLQTVFKTIVVLFSCTMSSALMVCLTSFGSSLSPLRYVIAFWAYQLAHSDEVDFVRKLRIHGARSRSHEPPSGSPSPAKLRPQSVAESRTRALPAARPRSICSRQRRVALVMVPDLTDRVDSPGRRKSHKLTRK